MEREQRVNRLSRRETETESKYAEHIRLTPEAMQKFSDTFAMQQLGRLPWVNVSYEYKVDGEWIKGMPQKKPEEKRLSFGDESQFELVKDIYGSWQVLSDMKVDNPIYPEEVFKRIAGPPITSLLAFRLGQVWWMKNYPYRPFLELFIPWGVRSAGKFGEPEISVLDRIQSLRDNLRKNRIAAGVLLMPADLYATDVNRQVTSQQAKKYFQEVGKAARGRKFEVKPWSEIRSENQERYQNRAAELTKDELIRILGREYVEEAVETARRRSGYRKEQDIVNAALAYLRERICEAEIVEDVYKPIKVSAVTKGKDNRVDRDLPRIYVIPPELRFPWLKTA